MSTPIAPRCALVLETNNLRGGDAAHNAVLESLQRAVAALAAQTVPLTALAQLIVTHDGLNETACAALSGIAGRPVTLSALRPPPAITRRRTVALPPPIRRCATT